MAQGDPSHSTAETFAELALELYDAPSVAETAETVLSFALQALNCEHAGLSLTARGGRWEIAAFTDPVVEELYERQIADGQGPAFDAVAGRHTISVPNVAAESRWPQWAARVRAAGINSVIHIPLTTPVHTIGVLSLFSAKTHAFSDDDEAIAYLLAQHASIAVADARHDETMAQAVDARKIVGQAMGILMERFDVDEDRAFAILRRYSQDSNRKLRDVAQDLIETRRLPG